MSAEKHPTTETKNPKLFQKNPWKIFLNCQVQLQQEVISCKSCISLQILPQLNKLSNHSQ